MSNIIDTIERENMKTDVPEFSIGDTVAVFKKIIEGKRERIQKYGYRSQKRRYSRNFHR